MEPDVTILLVDDERRNLDSLEAVLSDADYRLLRAENADAALRLLLENDVAAIVLDIKMPGVSGFELARLIKGSKKFREIPIVFLTAHMLEDQDVLTGYGAGAVDYLTKPVNAKILRHKVAVFAELFRKTRALAELNSHLELRVHQRTAELEASEAALRAAGQQKDAFLATLAHELRNPLAPLRTGLSVLLKLPVATESVARTLTAMNRQLDHMVRLIDDLLDVSRVSRGLLELRTAHVNLAALIDTAIETCAPFVDKRGQKVTAYASTPIWAVVDATRICQIIGNLLHNASKFTPEGGEIEIRLAERDGTATIRVVDSGVGIASDHLAHVFQMFATMARSTPNSGGGLGIGLALSRHLAELHGGKLTAESSGEGQGATFTLSLPLASRVPTVVAANDTERVSTTTGDDASTRLDVVVIEDNDDAAAVLSVWLESSGHRVHVARTGDAGLALVHDVRPDVVLCDVGLPGMDGVEVCRRVRLEVSPRPVMVALTGWGADADRRRTENGGFDRHLVKPVATNLLSEVLADVAASKRRRTTEA